MNGGKGREEGKQLGGRGGKVIRSQGERMCYGQG